MANAIPASNPNVPFGIGAPTGVGQPIQSPQLSGNVATYSTDSSGNPTGLVGPSGQTLSVSSTAPYIGPVANRGGIPGIATSSFQNVSCRTKHIAMDSFLQCKIALPNFYLENNIGAILTYQASIEWPVGTTVTVATFSGATSGSTIDGGLLVSDWIQLPSTIPRGAVFYSRVYLSGSSVPYYVNPSLGNGATGEWCIFGTTGGPAINRVASLTNESANNYGPGNYMKPSAILGYTTRPTYALVGDSRFQSNVATQCDPFCNSYGGFGESQRSVDKLAGNINLGSSGDSIVGSATNFSRRAQLSAYCSHVIIGYGINDFTATRTAANVIIYLYTFIANYFSNKGVYVCTVGPKSADTTSGWGTVAAQTPDSTSHLQRTIYNSFLRSGLQAPVLGHIDSAQYYEYNGSGVYKPAQRSATDCAITSGTATLTSTALAQFSQDDIGKTVSILGAGAAGAPLLTIISAVASATSCTVSNNASTTVASAGTVYIGTYTTDGLHPSYWACRQIEESGIYKSSILQV